MENENENIDSPNDDGTQETEQPLETEVTEPTLDDFNALKEKNKQLFERAKKAENEAKALKAKPVETKTEINKSNETVGLTRDEAILIAKGVDDRIIDEAKIVAEAKKIPLREALEYPTIKAFKQSLEAEERKKKARLGASGGSAGSDPDDLTEKVGMTREEHRKAIGF